jgi:UDP-glucose 4-epimerase
MGQGLRRSLSSEGCSVTIVGRTNQASLAPNERFFSVKDHSFAELASLMSGTRVEAIIDLAYASVPNTSYADPVADFSENLANVIQHLDFAIAVQARRFMYVSSGGTVYGDLGVIRPYSEIDPNFPLAPYGITKMACERYVYMYHKLHGLDTLIVRPSNIYGPGQKPFRGQGLVATALGIGWKSDPVQIFGDGSHIRDYLYIDDFCSGVHAIMASGEPGGIYNLGYGKGHSITDIIGCIDEAIAADGRQLLRKYQPERPFDVHYNVLDISKVHTATGWLPHTTLREGVRNTWQWMKEYMTTTA